MITQNIRTYLPNDSVQQCIRLKSPTDQQYSPEYRYTWSSHYLQWWQ